MRRAPENDPELLAIARAVTAAARGAGELLVVRGPDGVGKSTLLDAATALSLEAGVDVLVAHGAGLEQEFPFALALQLFEPRLGRATDEEHASLFSGAAARAAPLFEGRPSDGGHESSLAFYEGLYELTLRLAGDAGLLVVVDDAHWADRMSLGFLLYLADRIGDVPVSIVLTFRPGGRGAPIDQLEELCAHPAANVLQPSPSGGSGGSEGGVPAVVGGLGERGLLAHTAFERTLRGGHRIEAVALAMRAYGDGDLLELDATGGATLHLVYAVLAWSDELDVALAVADAAIARAQAAGSLEEFAPATYARAWPVFLQGRIADAIECIEEGFAAGAGVWHVYLPLARRLLVSAHIEREDVAAAAAATSTDGTPDAVTPWGGLVAFPSVLYARAEVALAQDRPADALAMLLEVGHHLVDVLGVLSPAVLPWRSTASTVALRLGDDALARSLAEEDLALARATGVPRAIGVAMRALGVALGGAPGVERLQAAVGVLAGSQSRLEYMRALVDLGTALRREGQREDARVPLRAALDMAHRGGALALARRASEELVATGARPRRPVLSGPESLTASERRVASMAARSMTNREIADALFVSTKTVESHLRNVFVKLGISSRRELPSHLK